MKYAHGRLTKHRLPVLFGFCVILWYYCGIYTFRSKLKILFPKYSTPTNEKPPWTKYGFLLFFYIYWIFLLRTSCKCYAEYTTDCVVTIQLHPLFIQHDILPSLASSTSSELYSFLSSENMYCPPQWLRCPNILCYMTMVASMKWILSSRKWFHRLSYNIGSSTHK